MQMPVNGGYSWIRVTQSVRARYLGCKYPRKTLYFWPRKFVRSTHVRVHASQKWKGIHVNFMPGKQFPRVWRETGGKYLLNNTDKTKETSVLCGNPNYGDEGNWIWKNWNGVDFESVHAELWSLINWIRKYRKDFWDVFIFYSRELWVIEEELMIDIPSKN